MSRTSTEPLIMVVIPTRDRLDDLRQCLTALREQSVVVPFEVVVVDDGSDPAVDPAELERSVGDGSPWVALRVIRLYGCGPAQARDIGWRSSTSDVIAFTDDDTVPCPGWLQAAWQTLESDPELAGVEGPTVTRDYDYLSEHSVGVTEPPGFVTCNIAYRRGALEKVGGFSHDFPYPHAEDLDLGFRVVRQVGPLGWSADMKVEHPPRPVSIAWHLRRAKVFSSNILLVRRNPSWYARPEWVPVQAYVLWMVARGWIWRALGEGWGLVRRPRRLAKFVSVALGQILMTAIAILKARELATVPVEPRPSDRVSASSPAPQMDHTRNEVSEQSSGIRRG